MQHFVHIQLACGVMQFSGNNFVYLPVFADIWSDGLQQQLFGILRTMPKNILQTNLFENVDAHKCDGMRTYAFQQKTWSIPARHTALWRSFENEYVQFCRQTFAL